MTATATHHLATRVTLALPLDVYVRAFPRKSGAFVLDGGGAPSARFDAFALLGAEPIAALRAYRSAERDAGGRALARVIVTEGDRTVRDALEDPFVALRRLLAEHAPPEERWQPLPLPLRAGVVGWIGYECGQLLERLPCAERPSIGMPDMAFFLHRWVLGTCRATGESWLSVLGRGETESEARRDAESARDRILRVLEAVELAQEALATPPRRLRARGRLDAYDFATLARQIGLRASLTRDEYIERVARAKRHIEEGDTFEICVTTAFEAPFHRDPWLLWEELRDANPAPFAAWLDAPEGTIVSSSPERLVSLREGGLAETRPIKGTRPRGATPEDDLRLARELASSEKDRAENAMIVDLARNDLGKVCRFGSVEAPELYAVEHYATVHQLVSTVRGRLDEGHDAIDLVRACFPPGSMTGAPKIEAMRILEALEPVERGIYAGAMGFLDLGGASMDLAVVIRTLVVREGRASFSVGGAVVADSDPAAEHAEALDKARALVATLAAVKAEGAAEEPRSALEERAS